MRSFKRGARFFLSVVLATLIGPAASLAAETSPPLTGLWITTPHPEFSLKPGEAGSIQLSVRNAHQPPQRLGLSLHTVETHRTRIMEKLDVHNAAELVLSAVRRGLIT